MSPFSKIVTTALLSTTAIPAAWAQEAPQADANAPADSDAIIVTGTRVTGMRAADSAAPIQVVGTQAIANVGQQDLTQVLAQSLAQPQLPGIGGDTANLTLSAALRGLSPNNTLVLVNGKRRHGTANLAVLGGSPYSGLCGGRFQLRAGKLDRSDRSPAGRCSRAVWFGRDRRRDQRHSQEEFFGRHVHRNRRSVLRRRRRDFFQRAQRRVQAR